MSVRIITNVPENEVESLVGIFKAEGATSVATQPEGDGEFTITAIFPDIERHGALIARRTGLGEQRPAAPARNWR